MKITDAVLENLRTFIVEDNAALGLVIDTRYEVKARIARGGMGEVFRAHDTRLNRLVAMKILAPELSGTEWAERFRVEAQTLGRIEHPGVVPIHDLGALPDDRLYYTMKFVEGRTLEDCIAAGEDRRALLSTLAAAADIVQHAHDRDVIHRDLKPANIMVDARRDVYVMDWGIARVVGDMARARGRSASAGLTQAGHILGTVPYMPPEQAQGDQDAIGQHSDVFSLGAILYEILTGRPPAEGATLREALNAAARCEPVPPRRRDPSIPPDLEAICLHALEPRPEHRHPSARALADDLRRFLGREPVARRVRKQWPVAVVLLAGIAIAAWAILKSQRRDEALRLLEDGRSALERAAAGEDVARRAAAARARIEEALAKSPDMAMGHYLLGRAWELEGWWDRAEASWLEAIRRDPAFGPAHYRLGRLLLLRTFVAATGHSQADILSRRPEARLLAAEAADHFAMAVAAASGWEDTPEREVAAALLSYLRSDGTFDGLVKSGLDKYGRVEAGADFHWLSGLSSADDYGPEPFDRALALSPRHFPALVCRGLTHVQRREWDRAIDDFSRALAVVPRSAMVLAGRAMVRIRTRDYAGALADCERALEIDPRCVQAYINRGAVRLQREEYDAATSDFERALSLAPGQPLAMANRGLGRYALGKHDGALEDLNAALAAEPDLAVALIGRAVLLGDRDRLKEALVDADRAVALEPSFAEMYFGRGRLRWLADDNAGAIADFDAGMRLNPDPGKQGMAYYYRGQARAGLREYDPALRDFDEAVRRCPGIADIHAGRAAARKASGDLKGALADLDEAIRLDPEDAHTYGVRGTVHYALLQLKEAVADYSEALRRKPTAAVYTNRGLALMHLGDVDAAILDHDRSIEMDAKSAGAYYNRALAYEERRQWAQGIADCSAAIALRKDRADFHVLRARLRKAAGDPQGQIADLDEALRCEPGNADARYARGVARYALKDLEGTIADFTEVIRAAPSAGAYTNRGLARADRGDVDGAIEDHTAALRLASGRSAGTCHFNRALAYRLKKDAVREKADIDRALELLPPDAPERKKIDLLLRELGE